MGVLDSIGMIEIVGLAVLALILFLVTRRVGDQHKRSADDSGTAAMMGTAAYVAHDRYESPTDVGGGMGGDGGGGF